MRKKVKKKNILLTDHIRALLEDQEVFQSLKPQARAKFYFDQRWRCGDSIEYLIFMLKHLREKDLEQIFNAKTMKPFFEALFNLEIKAESHEEYLRKKESEDKPEEIKKKRQRLLALSAETLSIIGRGDFAYNLLPEILRPYLTWSFPPIENFKAILSYSLHPVSPKT